MKRDRKEKFSIRKFSFGAASCLIGAQIAISGLASPAEAAMVTTRNDKGLVTLYANRGESPYDAAAIAVHDSINVDREIVVDVDWSSYSKTNPYVTVTYKYNGGFGASNYVANYGGSRPDYWFTTPVGAQEPSEIRLQTGTTDRVMKSWSADSPWVSFTNSVGSRYQTKEQVDSMGLGDDTKWERYNDTTQETGKTFLGDMAGMFNHRIGTQISDSPSDQGIFESFRTNTKSMYSDWDLARNDRVTITAKYKVADPTLKNGRRTLDFGAGVKVGRALQQLRHFKVVTTEIPVLYQDKELFEPALPERIGVVDTAKLTAEEKTLLKNKIWEKNQATKSDAIPENSHNKFIENVKQEDDGTTSANSSISIADDGTATITYGDGTQDVTPGTSLVYEKPQIDNIETTPANVGDYKYLKNPHAVDNINNITNSDVESARQKFFKVNGMTTTKNEDGDDVITAVGDASKTSQDFVGTNLEYDPRSQGFAVLRNSMPVGITIPKADLFKAKPTKVFSAAEAIEKAKQAIDNLTYLSPKEKEYYKNQLTGKTTQDDINKVVNSAIAKNSENEKAIEAKKRQVKDKINSAKYLTEAEKEALRKQVDSQGIEDPANGNGTGTQAADYTKELLDKIGQQADAKNLENAKKSTKEKIDQIKDSLKSPTADEYKTQIDGKTTVAEVEKVLEEAEKQKAKNEAQKAQEEAEKLKEDYKKQIDQIPGLSEADKAKYKQQIDQAKSKDQLENILNDAKAQASREKAKQTIEDLPHLNKAQKDELKEKVENASDKSEIDGIVSIAQGLDSKMDSLQKLVAEAEKVKASDKYTNPNVPQEKKTAFDKAKEAASKVADKNTAAPENAVGTSEVATLIDNLAKAIKELTGQDVAVPVSKDALKAEIDLNKDDAVKKSPAYAKETSTDKKKAYDDALVKAQEVFAKQDATQPQVDEALDKLQQARLALSGKAEEFTLAVTEAAKISKEPKAGESLTEQADKDAVKAKVTANGKALDDAYTVEYGTIAEKDGKKVVPITVTHDGVAKTIDVEVTKKAEEFTLAVKDETKPAKISKLPVAGESLTAEDEAKVKEKVTVNGEALKDTDTVKYGTIAEKDGKKIVPVTVTRGGVEKTVEVPVEGTDAAKSPLNDPEKVKVNNIANLSDDEKEAVKAAVKKANPNLTDTQISVDNTGKVTVTYSDKSQNELLASKTVEAKTEAEKALDKAKEKAKADLTEAANKEKAEIDADKNLTDQQKTDKKAEVDKVKKEQEAKIDGAQTTDEVAKATEVGKKVIDAVHQTELDKAKEKAKAKAEVLEEAQKRINEIKNNKDVSDEEKQKAIDAINKAKDKAIEDINKGQSKDEIDAAKDNGIKKINEVQPEGSIASKFEPKVPENKVEVKNPTKLSDEEREKVRQNIEGVNTFPDGTTVDVKADGTAVITYKDGSSDTISKDKLVAPAKKDEGTIASRIEPVIPGKIQVGNTTKLTPEEQAAVKKAVEEANNFPAGTTVEVRPDGTVVITYPDKSVDTITGDKLVEKSTKQTTPKAKTEAEKNPAQVPGVTQVENPTKLTPSEQSAVATKVKQANPTATDVKVSKDGTATLTYSDGSVNTIPGTSLVVAKDTEKEVATQAAQNPAKVPAVTEVGNTHSLTPEEQAAVAAKVKQINPTATDVKVSKDGTATLTYSDGSVNTIPGTRLVVQDQKAQDSNKTDAEKTTVKAPAQRVEVKDITHLTDEEKEAVRKAVVEANGFGSDVKVEVAGDGTATIVFKDGSAITIPGTRLVVQDPKAQDSNKTDAEKTTVKAPAQRVEVKDITHLTDEEKEAVRKAVVEANGFGSDVKVEVAGDGTATITFPDGSVATILGKDTVQQSAKTEPAIEEKPEYTSGQDNGGNTGRLDDRENAGSNNASSEENTKGGIQEALAHTGLDNASGLGLSGLGLAMLGGLLAARRRKEK